MPDLKYIHLIVNETKHEVMCVETLAHAEELLKEAKSMRPDHHIYIQKRVLHTRQEK